MRSTLEASGMKLSKYATEEEPILRWKFNKLVQPAKHSEKFVTFVFLANRPFGTDAREVHPVKVS